ncbi:hypothetical protein DIE70_22945 [Salmonella enterica subsp. enterica serovar Senftenberg]|nr:hypothetical protein [Salmonella enterica subsp. enterica serovar Senftenberg]
MRIENLKMKCLYKKHRFSGKEDFSDMIDVITSQGGIDKIKIIPEYGDINDNTIKFLKVIGFDINTLNIEVGTIESGIALIKNGYNLYKTGSAWIPSIAKEVAIKWSAAPDMTPQTVLYRRPVAQFSNFQPKIVSSWLILALFQANFLISGRSRLCPYQLVNSNQVRQGE